MKKNAFTLAEVLVALGIIGIVAALTLPHLAKLNQEAGVGSLLSSTQTTLEEAFGRIIIDNPRTPLSSLNVEAELSKHLAMFSGSGGYTLKNGVVLSFSNEKNGSVPGGEALKNIYIDINGDNPPGIEGVDKFTFTLSSHGLVIPQTCAGMIANNGWKIPKGYSAPGCKDYNVALSNPGAYTPDDDDEDCESGIYIGSGANKTCCNLKTDPTCGTDSDPCATVGKVKDASGNCVCPQALIDACTAQGEGYYLDNNCNCIEPGTTDPCEGVTCGQCEKCENGSCVEDLAPEGCAPCVQDKECSWNQKWSSKECKCVPRCATGETAWQEPNTKAVYCYKCEGDTWLNFHTGACNINTPFFSPSDFNCLASGVCPNKEVKVNGRRWTGAKENAQEELAELFDKVLYNKLYTELKNTLGADWNTSGYGSSAYETFDQWFVAMYLHSKAAIIDSTATINSGQKAYITGRSGSWHNGYAYYNPYECIRGFLETMNRLISIKVTIINEGSALKADVDRKTGAVEPSSDSDEE